MTSSSTTSLVETHRLSKRYRGTVALESVTLSIPPGSIYALVGANGAGRFAIPGNSVCENVQNEIGNFGSFACR